jgi:PAS domain S-box-containing protein
MQPDGVVRWVRERTFPVLNESGELYRMAGIIEDITQRKETEEALRSSEERFRTLFEDSPIPLWEEDFSAVKACLDQLHDQGVMDFEAYFEQHPEAIQYCVNLIRLIDTNQAALKLSQAKDKAEALSSLDKIVTSDSLKAFKQELMTVARGKTKLEYENITYNLSGARVHTNVTWIVAPGYEETYAKVLISIIDITELKRAEAALRESEQRYRELALHNAQLYLESQKRLKEQTALLKATTVISSSLDSPTILKSIAEQMGQTIDATSAYICSYEPETMTSTVLAEYLSPQASPAEQVSDFIYPVIYRLLLPSCNLTPWLNSSTQMTRTCLRRKKSIYNNLAHIQP